jgi:hypothetical protein
MEILGNAVGERIGGKEHYRSFVARLQAFVGDSVSIRKVAEFVRIQQRDC